MIVLVTGDRNWTDKNTIKWALHGFPKDSVLIHGACKGADSIAHDVATELGWVDRIAVFADWEGFGKAAGPIRNKFMLDEHKPDLVIAFHSNLAKSKGTKNMCTQAKEAGVPVIVIRG